MRRNEKVEQLGLILYGNVAIIKGDNSSVHISRFP